MNEPNERYQYSYSSKEQEEIRKIREKIAPEILRLTDELSKE